MRLNGTVTGRPNAKAMDVVLSPAVTVRASVQSTSNRLTHLTKVFAGHTLIETTGTVVSCRAIWPSQIEIFSTRFLVTRLGLRS
jgi:hypothetical protein